MTAGAWSSWSLGTCSQEEGRDDCWCSSPSLHFYVTWDPIYLRWIVLPQITLARKALTGTPGTVFYGDPYFRQSSWQHWFTTTVTDSGKMCLHTQKQYSLYSYDTVLQTPDAIPELAISNLTKKGTCLWVIASRQMCLQTCSVVTWFSQITRVFGAEQRLFVWCRQAFMQPRYQK